MSLRNPRYYIRIRPGEKPPPIRCPFCGLTPCQTLLSCGRRQRNQEQAERLKRAGTENAKPGPASLPPTELAGWWCPCGARYASLRDLESHKRGGRHMKIDTGCIL